MTRIGSWAFAALSALAVQGCGGDEVVAPQPPADIVFATIWQDGYWNCAEVDSSVAAVFVFTDHESWRSFCIGRFIQLPVADFEHEVVLALLDRASPEETRVNIESVRREHDRIVVRATRRTGCWDVWMPAPPFRPFHVVRINRPVAPVDLHVIDVACPP
jgi:hypothetical protein